GDGVPRGLFLNRIRNGSISDDCGGGQRLAGDGGIAAGARPAASAPGFRSFFDGPRCLRLNWGPAALSSIAVGIGLAIRLARSWIPASSWMIVARANRRRRTQNHFAA